jgi:cobyrinic acid a,c-diamide synthase
MEIIGVCLMVLAIIVIYIDADICDRTLGSMLNGLFNFAVVLGIAGAILVFVGAKREPHTIKNIKEFSVEETVIYKDSVPTDTLYNITYKK